LLSSLSPFGGEGRGEGECALYRHHHTFKILANIGIAETKDAISTPFKKSGPALVIIGLIPVRIAIDFDNEHARDSTGEINDIAANYRLLPKLCAVKAFGAKSEP